MLEKSVFYVKTKENLMIEIFSLKQLIYSFTTCKLLLYHKAVKIYKINKRAV